MEKFLTSLHNKVNTFKATQHGNRVQRKLHMYSAVPASTVQSVMQQTEGDTWELCGYPQVLWSGVEIQGQGKAGMD